MYIACTHTPDPQVQPAVLRRGTAAPASEAVSVALRANVFVSDWDAVDRARAGLLHDGLDDLVGVHHRDALRLVPAALPGPVVPRPLGSTT